ncbi:MAG: peptidoglycan-binding protein, partial [Steroidobacter sp.]
QNLAPDTLEQVRMLTNLETSTHKLLQIILIGQPELREVLARSELRQLAQRITGRYHLAPLTREDAAAYVRHRMKVAGAREDVFSESALREIHRRSKGVPRLINIICDRALLGAYTLESYEIDARLIKEAANEVAGHWRTHHWWPWVKLSTVTLLIITTGVMAFFWSVSKPVATPAVVVHTPEKTQPVTRPPPADINVLFKQTGDTSGTDSALAALFDLWHVKFNPTTDNSAACDQATAAGLECVYQKGVWAQLLALNRPAILQLNDDAGTVHQIVLASLQNGNAQVIAGNQKHEVTVESLARYWNGDYLVLWRPQVTSQRTLSYGMRNNDIAWIRNTLNVAQSGSPADSSSQSANPSESSKSKNLFDDSLMKQVIEFQRTHHLNADGVVGVQTQIALDAMLNHDHGPLLVDNPNS